MLFCGLAIITQEPHETGVKRNFWPRRVHMHRMILYISNTLRKLMI